MEKKRHAQFSEAISTTWNRVYENFKIFINGDTIPFSKIDLKLIEEFRLYLYKEKRCRTPFGESPLPYQHRYKLPDPSVICIG